MCIDQKNLCQKNHKSLKNVYRDMPPVIEKFFFYKIDHITY